jgi:hypothetical protein
MIFPIRRRLVGNGLRQLCRGSPSIGALSIDKCVRDRGGIVDFDQQEPLVFRNAFNSLLLCGCRQKRRIRDTSIREHHRVYRVIRAVAGFSPGIARMNQAEVFARVLSSPAKSNQAFRLSS